MKLETPTLTARLMVGMEIHVELATRSKMWTSAPNVAHPDHFDAAPNSLLDPVVIGMPGTLPVMNKAALEMSVVVGLALNCDIARFSKWDRKSYYYPDLPKNYQLSQYDQPICGEGWMEFAVGEGEAPAEPRPGAAVDSPDTDRHGIDDGPAAEPRPGAAVDSRLGRSLALPRTKKVRIIRAHLEEDAGKLLHEAPGGFAIDHSIVDLNRAGTPLLEIVTHPDIESADEAVAFCQALRDLCRACGVTEGIMQKGHIRFEPNINVIIEKDGQTYKTPIVEVKNLNSFKAVHGAIQHEFERQLEEWQQTGVVMGKRAKTTRGWDDTTGTTFLQRAKEDADEYRYFPDPDLVPVVVSEEWLEQLKARLPELPAQKEKRYLEVIGLSASDAAQLLAEPRTAGFFDAVVAHGGDGRKAAKMILNSVAKRANEHGCRVDELGATPKQVAKILSLVAEGKVSAAAADELLLHCCDPANREADPAALAEKHRLMQVSDTGALEGFVDTVLADPKNAKAVADLRAGKDKAIGAIMGQVMKLSKGQANPAVVTEMIKSKLQ